MRAGALLASATELLRRVLAFDEPADRAVADYFRKHHAFGPRERHALAETVYEVLRRRLLYEHLAEGGPGSLERRLAILAWGGDAGAPSAALDAAEAAWLARTASIDRHTLAPALRHNLPDWLARLLADEAADAFWPLVESLDRTAPLDLRANLAKTTRDALRAELKSAGIASEPTRYSPWGLRVAGKPALEKLDLFVAGKFEVQDEGSQLLALVTGAKRGEMVVDFCAGAGGKTLALGAAMRDTGRLYAFDTSGERQAALGERVARSGLSNVHPIRIAHEHDERVARLAGKADRVLVDAPCSGLGTLRRNPDLKWRQSPQSIAAFGEQQRAILDAASRLVKPGGVLVYATCSLLAAENEAIADGFTQERAAFLPVPAVEALRRARVADPADLVQGNGLRLWPHRHATDGFFAALWRRSA